MFAGWLRDHLTAAGLAELSGEEIAARLDIGQIDQLMALYEAEKSEQKFRKFENIFPDKYRKIGDGDWSEFYPRHLYPRHMEFFREGATYDERCFMAGNRVGKCRLYGDTVQHPDGTTSRIGDLFVKAEPFDVLAWDGSRVVSAPASHVVRKPPEPVVELFLSSGARFTCSLDHVLLTDAGWQRVRHLLRSALVLPASNSAPDPLTHAGGDPHWSRTAQYLRERCPASPAYDERPLDEREIVRVLSPSQGGARRHTPASSPSDGQARTRSDTLSRSARRPSSLYAALLNAARFAASGGRDACRSSRHTTGSLPAHWQLRLASACLSRSTGEGDQDQSERGALVSPGIAGNRVVAYRHMGVHALYDLTVPDLRNYVADGVVHHNTVVGGFETTCHLTGLYPDWWEGRRFRHAIRAIAAGDTTETTRDIIQAILFGEVLFDGARKSVDGTGLIPLHLIGREPGQMQWRRSIDLIDSVKIKHSSGGWSKLQLKSYEQGRKIFQGTTQHLIWVDEEPPLDVYDEARMRTMTVNGITLLTYTPLEGLTETVLSFLPVAMRPAGNETLATGDWGSWHA